MAKKGSKIKKYALYSLAAVGVILIALIIIGLMVSPRGEAEAIIDSISESNREIGYSLQTIGTSFESIGKEESMTQGALDRTQNELIKINENIGAIETEIESIENDIDKLEELGLPERFDPFIEKLTEGVGYSKLSTEYLEDFVGNFGKLMSSMSDYLKAISYLEELEKDGELLELYFETEDYDKAKETLNDAIEKTTLAKNEFTEADQIVSFSFNTKVTAALEYYTDAMNLMTEAITFLEGEDYEKAEEKVDEALELMAKATEEMPTDSEIEEETEQWSNDNIYYVAEGWEEAMMNAQKSYDEAWATLQ
jgi:tetratricopeptide (TPR) repeat protein